MKRDPYHHKECFENWISKQTSGQKIRGLNNSHSRLLIKFIKDFRIGLNVSTCSKKGERSFARLNNLRHRMVFIIRQINDRGVKDIREVSAKDLHNLFSDMRSGVLRTKQGTPYKSTGDYIKVFKTFWHWHQKVKKHEGILIPDITEDLDTRGNKAKFVYFTKEDFERILAEASFDIKPIVALAFDSGMRVTELFNIKVSDFQHDYRELTVRDETSKTFGRRIKLMICPDQIKAFVKLADLKNDDYLSKLNPASINKELSKIGKKILSAEQTRFKSLSLKDFRHSSACFWLNRYKSESAMKYRFGWKKSDMIHYYTEFLGMKDTINQDDMYVDITKTELEKEVERLRGDITALKESVKELITTAAERNI